MSKMSIHQARLAAELEAARRSIAIVEACAAAGKPLLAADFLRRRLTLEQARRELASSAPASDVATMVDALLRAAGEPLPRGRAIVSKERKG